MPVKGGIMKLNGYYHGYDFENPKDNFTHGNLKENSLGLIKLLHISTEAIKGAL